MYKVSVFLAIVVGVLGVQTYMTFIDLSRLYTINLKLLQEEQWLHQQCQRDDFVQNLPEMLERCTQVGKRHLMGAAWFTADQYLQNSTIKMVLQSGLQMWVFVFIWGMSVTYMYAVYTRNHRMRLPYALTY